MGVAPSPGPTTYSNGSGPIGPDLVAGEIIAIARYLLVDHADHPAYAHILPGGHQGLVAAATVLRDRTDSATALEPAEAAKQISSGQRLPTLAVLNILEGVARSDPHVPQQLMQSLRQLIRQHQQEAPASGSRQLLSKSSSKRRVRFSDEDTAEASADAASINRDAGGAHSRPDCQLDHTTYTVNSCSIALEDSKPTSTATPARSPSGTQPAWASPPTIAPSRTGSASAMHNPHPDSSTTTTTTTTRAGSSNAKSIAQKIILGGSTAPPPLQLPVPPSCSATAASAAPTTNLHASVSALVCLADSDLDDLFSAATSPARAGPNPSDAPAPTTGAAAAAATIAPASAATTATRAADNVTSCPTTSTAPAVRSLPAAPARGSGDVDTRLQQLLQASASPLQPPSPLLAQPLPPPQHTAPQDPHAADPLHPQGRCTLDLTTDPTGNPAAVLMCPAASSLHPSTVHPATRHALLSASTSTAASAWQTTGYSNPTYIPSLSECTSTASISSTLDDPPVPGPPHPHPHPHPNPHPPGIISNPLFVRAGSSSKPPSPMPLPTSTTTPTPSPQPLPNFTRSPPKPKPRPPTVASPQPPLIPRQLLSHPTTSILAPTPPTIPPFNSPTPSTPASPTLTQRNGLSADLLHHRQPLSSHPAATHSPLRSSSRPPSPDRPRHPDALLPRSRSTDLLLFSPIRHPQPSLPSTLHTSKPYCPSPPTTGNTTATISGTAHGHFHHQPPHHSLAGDSPNPCVAALAQAVDEQQHRLRVAAALDHLQPCARLPAALPHQPAAAAPHPHTSSTPRPRPQSAATASASSAPAPADAARFPPPAVPAAHARALAAAHARAAAAGRAPAATAHAPSAGAAHAPAAACQLGPRQHGAMAIGYGTDAAFRDHQDGVGLVAAAGGSPMDPVEAATAAIAAAATAMDRQPAFAAARPPAGPGTTGTHTSIAPSHPAGGTEGGKGIGQGAEGASAATMQSASMSSWLTGGDGAGVSLSLGSRGGACAEVLERPAAASGSTDRHHRLEQRPHPHHQKQHQEQHHQQQHHQHPHNDHHNHHHHHHQQCNSDDNSCLEDILRQLGLSSPAPRPAHQPNNTHTAASASSRRGSRPPSPQRPVATAPLTPTAAPSCQLPTATAPHAPNHPTADHPTADHPTTDHPPTDHPPTEVPPTDQAGRPEPVGAEQRLRAKALVYLARHGTQLATGRWPTPRNPSLQTSRLLHQALAASPRSSAGDPADEPATSRTPFRTSSPEPDPPSPASEPSSCSSSAPSPCFHNPADNPSTSSSAHHSSAAIGQDPADTAFNYADSCPMPQTQDATAPPPLTQQLQPAAASQTSAMGTTNTTTATALRAQQLLAARLGARPPQNHPPTSIPAPPPAASTAHGPGAPAVPSRAVQADNPPSHPDPPSPAEAFQQLMALGVQPSSSWLRPPHRNPRHHQPPGDDLSPNSDTTPLNAAQPWPKHSTPDPAPAPSATAAHPTSSVQAPSIHTACNSERSSFSCSTGTTAAQAPSRNTAATSPHRPAAALAQPQPTASTPASTTAPATANAATSAPALKTAATRPKSAGSTRQQAPPHQQHAPAPTAPTKSAAQPKPHKGPTGSLSSVPIQIPAPAASLPGGQQQQQHHHHHHHHQNHQHHHHRLAAPPASSPQPVAAPSIPRPRSAPAPRPGVSPAALQARNSQQALGPGEGYAKAARSRRPGAACPVVAKWQQQEVRQWLQAVGVALLPQQEAAPFLDHPLRNGTLLCDLAAALTGTPVPGAAPRPRHIRAARANIVAALDHLGVCRPAASCAEQQVEAVLQGSQDAAWHLLGRIRDAYRDPLPLCPTPSSYASLGVQPILATSRTASRTASPPQGRTPPGPGLPQQAEPNLLTRRSYREVVLPYSPDQRTLLERSLVAWLHKLGLLQLEQVQAGFPAVLPHLADGTLLCQLVACLTGAPVKGALKKALTPRTRAANIRKALDALQPIRRLSKRYLQHEEALCDGSRAALTGLLEDLHRLHDNQPPQPPTPTPGEAPYLPFLTQVRRTSPARPAGALSHPRPRSRPASPHPNRIISLPTPEPSAASLPASAANGRPGGPHPRTRPPPPALATPAAAPAASVCASPPKRPPAAHGSKPDTQEVARLAKRVQASLINAQVCASGCSGHSTGSGTGSGTRNGGGHAAAAHSNQAPPATAASAAAAGAEERGGGGVSGGSSSGEGGNEAQCGAIAGVAAEQSTASCRSLPGVAAGGDVRRSAQRQQPKQPKQLLQAFGRKALQPPAGAAIKGKAAAGKKATAGGGKGAAAVAAGDAGQGRRQGKLGQQPQEEEQQQFGSFWEEIAALKAAVGAWEACEAFQEAAGPGGQRPHHQQQQQQQQQCQQRQQQQQQGQQQQQDDPRSHHAHSHAQQWPYSQASSSNSSTSGDADSDQHSACSNELDVRGSSCCNQRGWGSAGAGTHPAEHDRGHMADSTTAAAASAAVRWHDNGTAPDYSGARVGLGGAAPDGVRWAVPLGGGRVPAGGIAEALHHLQDEEADQHCLHGSPLAPPGNGKGGAGGAARGMGRVGVADGAATDRRGGGGGGGGVGAAGLEGSAEVGGDHAGWHEERWDGVGWEQQGRVDVRAAAGRLGSVGGTGSGWEGVKVTQRPRLPAGMVAASLWSADAAGWRDKATLAGVQGPTLQLRQEHGQAAAGVGTPGGAPPVMIQLGRGEGHSGGGGGGRQGSGLGGGAGGWGATRVIQLGGV